MTGNIERSTVDPSKVKIEIPQQSPEEQREETVPPDFGQPSQGEELQKQFEKK